MGARLALADEARRRGDAGLSCEDLPSRLLLRRDSCGRWYGDHTPLTPGQPPRGTPCSEAIAQQRLDPPATPQCGDTSSTDGTDGPVPDAIDARFASSVYGIRRCLPLASEPARGVLVIVISRDGEHRLVDLAGPCGLATGAAATCIQDAVRGIAVENYERIRWWMRFE